MILLPTGRRSRSFLGWTAASLPLLFALLAGAAPSPQKPAATKAAKSPAQAAPAPAKLRYNRDIRPILAENCFACHGPDSAARKAGLRLDRFADATADRSGHAPIVKGKPDASEVVRRITGQGPIMPPAAGHKALTPQQILLLKQWIAQGAEYEQHWAYQPPVRPTLPAVKDTKWVRNPIDRFILARLEKMGLRPAPEADRRTLARRVSLDLTGLPPEPADVEAFVADKSPDAYEKLVDKFLASPQWGEHRARYWLDAARYADTNGIHFDNYREIWAYRDWVIRSFNKNMPFDQFTIEQLAGDLLPNPTLDQIIATGFNRCNITTNEGGVIPEEYAVFYARDRTETTSAVWLGSTLNCSVCHDHKFDPFTQKDFYSLSAFFNNTTQPVMDGNIQNTPPVMMVPREEDRARFEKIGPEIAEARKQADARKLQARAEYDKSYAERNNPNLQGTVTHTIVPEPSDKLLFYAGLSEGQGRDIQATLNSSSLHLAAAADPGWDTGHIAAKAFQRKPGSVIEIPAAGDFDKNQAFSYAAWVKIPNVNFAGAIVARMDDMHDYRGWDLWIENGRVGTHIISKWPENALKTVTTDPISPGQWHHVCVTYNGNSNTSGVQVYVDGTLRPTADQANALRDTIRTKVPLKIGQRHTTAGVDGTSIQDVRLYGKALSQREALDLASTTRANWLFAREEKLTAAEKDELYNWWLTNTDETYRNLSSKVVALVNEQQTIQKRGTEAHVMHERSEEAMAYILARGDYDKRRDPVKPITPAVLPPIPSDLPHNRLGLAKWLLLPENPLPARVTVNRFWQELFGTGLVKTTSDFGVNGEIPIHPELLDWLAVEFREGGWNIKKFYKMLVMSAAYRQSAVTTPEKQRKDPDNRLVSHGPRFRMDGEMVRDYALASSGLLVRKLGGPSVKPYQPDGVWEAVAMIGSNTRDYRRDTGESLYRRSLYTLWKRAAPPASLEIFNAPSRETCVVRRERTNTPLQALVTLNDVQFIEAARILAQKALKEGGTTPESHIDLMARRLLSRPLRPEETSIVKRSLADLETFYNGHSKEAQELITTGESKADPNLKPETLAAWTMLANQMMNLDEVLNK